MKKSTWRWLIWGLGAAAALEALLVTLDGILFARNRHTAQRIYEKGQKVNRQANASENQLRNQLDQRIGHLPFEYHYLKNSRKHILSARLYKPETPSDVYIIGSHGYRSTGINEFEAFLEYWLGKGFNVLLPDHQAHGRSEGHTISFGEQESKDIRRWIDYILRHENPEARIGLHGVSMGAATVLQTATQDDLPWNVRFVISDCAYGSAPEQIKIAMRYVNLPGWFFPAIAAHYRLFHRGSLYRVNGYRAVKNLHIPVLYIHGMQDSLIPYDNSQRLYLNTATDDKDLLLVPEADHAQSWHKAKSEYKRHVDALVAKALH